MRPLASFLAGKSPHPNPPRDPLLEAAALGDSFLHRPTPPPEVAEACEQASSGPEAWEILVARGLIPEAWACDPTRRYVRTCPHCTGAGATLASHTCPSCLGTSTSPTLGEPMPLGLEMAAQLAAAPTETARAEALAQEAAGRLGLPWQGPLWWGMSQLEMVSYQYGLGHYRALERLQIAARGGLSFRECIQGQNYGARYRDAFWETDPCGQVRFPSPYGLTVDPTMTFGRFAAAREISRQLLYQALAPSPDFLEPMRAIWALGFGVTLRHSEHPEGGALEEVVLVTFEPLPRG